MKEIVYSTQASNFLKGRIYGNPRHFSTPRDGVSKVYVVGYWPEVVAAYRSIGVVVHVVEEVDYFGDPQAIFGDDNQQAAPKEKQQPERNLADLAAIEIPENWKEMPWVGNDGLRNLAQKFSDDQILNKGQATAAIRAELKRRGLPDDD